MVKLTRVLEVLKNYMKHLNTYHDLGTDENWDISDEDAMRLIKEAAPVMNIEEHENALKQALAKEDMDEYHDF